MADQLTITGKFLGAHPVESVGQNGYQVRRFYLDNTTNADWPSTPEFKLKGDRVTQIDTLKKGQTIQVSFNVQGTRYDKRATGGKQGVITELIAWKINVLQLQSAGAPAQPTARPAPQQAAAPAPTGGLAQNFQHLGDADDDLPF